MGCRGSAATSQADSFRICAKRGMQRPPAFAQFHAEPIDIQLHFLYGVEKATFLIVDMLLEQLGQHADSRTVQGVVRLHRPELGNQAADFRMIDLGVVEHVVVIQDGTHRGVENLLLDGIVHSECRADGRDQFGPGGGIGDRSEIAEFVEQAIDLTMVGAQYGERILGSGMRGQFLAG